MKLDRNINPSGKGKYTVINMRKIPSFPQNAQELAAAILANPECVEFGEVGAPDEFFLIKLKDRYSEAALRAYADAAHPNDHEYAAAIAEMAHEPG